MWKIWYAAWWTTKDATEKLASSDVLDLIRALVEEKVVVACLKDPLLNPDAALSDVLEEFGIREKEFSRIVRP